MVDPMTTLLHQLPCHQQQVLLWMFLVRENLELKRHIPPLLNLLLGQMTYCDAINRRGIVSLSSGSEKPSLSVEELLENRRRGMSYASNGS